MVNSGCEFVRITAPSVGAAKNLSNIKNELRKQGYNVPLIADIHFDYKIAIQVAEHGADCLRINPGNIGNEKKVKEVSKKLKRNIKLLIGKPGLDGHSNGAEQIAMRAKEAGFDVVYQGIRLTPNQIVNSALEESVHIIGLSILSGSHLEILEDLTNLLKAKNMTKIPVIVGGIIPEKDFEIIRKMGVKKVYTPKDYDLNTIISDMSDFVEQSAA